MSYAKKDVRSFVKFLRTQVLQVEDLGKNKHIKIQITTETNDGEIITLPKICIPSTPSDANWEK